MKIHLKEEKRLLELLVHYCWKICVVDSERFHLNVFSAMFPRESAWRKLDRVTQKRGESLLALIRTYVVKTFQISPFS